MGQINDNQEEIIYFELNHWDTNHFPDCEPFLTWMSDDEIGNYLGSDEWVKEHNICVVCFPVDMSLSYLVTAPKSFVEKECSELLSNEEYHKFLRYPEKGCEVPESKLIYGEYFLPYTEEFIGVLKFSENWY